MVRFPLSAVMAVVTIGALAATGASLSGCVVAAGGGVVSGYAVLGEDLSPEQQLRDYRIKAAVVGAWGAFNQDMVHRLDATVFDGQVLITGHAPDRRWREEAVRRTWRVGGVKRVFDEVAVGPDTHFIDSARDTWITTQLRGELIADMDVKSINYVIKTNDGVVYIMGFARRRSELRHVIGHARTIAGVRRVLSFITVMPAPEEQLNAPPPPDEAPGPDQDMAPDRDMGPGPGPSQDMGPGPDEDRGAPPPPPSSGGGGAIHAEPLGPQ
jgi:osmotically-inducible protein OsmY